MKKICIPFIPKNKNEILSFYGEVSKFSPDLIEIWFDNINLDDIEEIVSKKPFPLIWVCKWKEEKWTFNWTEEERIEKLLRLCEKWADYVDIWFHTDKKLINNLLENKKDTKLIISYHNWSKTPKMTVMLSVINKITTYNPDYIKYVTTAEDKYDNVQVYRLCENLMKKKLNYIVMAMWWSWKQSRAICPILGSSWTYCPLSTENITAPWQIGFEDMRKLWELI